MKKADLVVVGAGGFAREVIWLAEATGNYHIVGLLDDKLNQGHRVGDYSILGGTADAGRFASAEFVVAVGSPRVRKAIVEKLIASGVKKFATIIHPSVQMSKKIKIGQGTVICAGTTLTVDIEIGEHNIININSTIGHDCRFGHFCTIAPLVAISGNVTLENCVEVGTGASLRQGVTIEAGGMLGMGAVLTKNIPTNEIYVGSPAKFLKKFE